MREQVVTAQQAQDRRFGGGRGRRNSQMTSRELRKFCQHHRTKESVRIETTDRPTFVDLFSGAGGLSMGFCRAGFRSLLTLDSDAEWTQFGSLDFDQAFDAVRDYWRGRARAGGAAHSQLH